MTIKESLQTIKQVWTIDEESSDYPDKDTIKEALYTLTKSLKDKAQTIDDLAETLKGEKINDNNSTFNN